MNQIFTLILAFFSFQSLAQVTGLSVSVTPSSASPGSTITINVTATGTHTASYSVGFRVQNANGGANGCATTLSSISIPIGQTTGSLSATVPATFTANFGSGSCAGTSTNGTAYVRAFITANTAGNPSAISAFAALTVLPIELSKFEVKNNQKSALLAWTTASEKDNALFKIQHSINGVDFTTISEMKGQGTINVNTDYNYEHSTPSVGINYYRLAQVDLNGTTTYSPIRSAIVGKKGGFAIKSNLIQNNLVVISSDNEATQLSIINTSGQLVLTTKVQGEQAIDVSSLPSGLYFVHTATGDTGRFVKQQ